MSSLQGNARPNARGKEWLEDRSVGDLTQGPIRQAAGVDLESVFKHYGLDAGKYNRSICCPFPFHKDRNPSFNYYPDTNSFHCFGCKTSGGPVHFVSSLLGTDKITAANHLIGNFESEDVESSFADERERDKMHLKFSQIIREFLANNRNQEAFLLADKVCYVFDEASRRHTMDIEGLRIIINKLEKLLNV